MTITQFGRIEVDPNLVPTAAPVRRSDDGDAPFARELSAATARRRQPQPVEREAEALPPANEPAVTGPEQPPTESRSSTPATATATATATPDNAAAAVLAAPPPQSDNGAGGADRRINTGQATASPASLSAAGNSGALVPDSAAPPTTTGAGAAPTIGAPATNAVPAARSAGTAPTATAPNGESSGSQATATASRATPGYRTLNPQTLQLAHDARDSLFKQIAFQLGEGRSEMRVLLNPPELGNLDLRLIVDKSGALQLSIITDRPELAAMLDRNAAELKLLLQSKGFGDVQTNVQAGDSGTQRHPEQHGRSARAARSAELDAADLAVAATARRRAGFITADSIDFFA